MAWFSTSLGVLKAIMHWDHSHMNGFLVSMLTPCTGAVTAEAAGAGGDDDELGAGGVGVEAGLCITVLDC